MSHGAFYVFLKHQGQLLSGRLLKYSNALLYSNQRCANAEVNGKRRQTTASRRRQFEAGSNSFDMRSRSPNKSAQMEPVCTRPQQAHCLS
jgi:hypothetical protein